MSAETDPVKPSFSIERWTPRRSGKLYGFATVRLGALRIADIKIIDGKNGPFAAMPSTAYEDREGKKHYTAIVEFADKGQGARFSQALVNAIHRIDETIPPHEGDATVTRLEPRRTDESRNYAQPELRRAEEFYRP